MRVLVLVSLLAACAPGDVVYTASLDCAPKEGGGLACTGEIREGAVVAPPPPADAPETPEDAPLPPVADAEADATRPPVPPDAALPPPVTATACEAGSGRDFLVAPGRPIDDLADVPWSGLGPGDTVRIAWRPEPYRERVMISTRGTPDAPIVVCGIRGPDGQRPVLDGQGSAATASSRYRSPSHATLGMVMTYVAAGGDLARRPAHVVIQGLEIRNVHPAYGDWSDAAAGIRVQTGGDNIVVRDNYIHHCANGVFASSTAGNPGEHELLTEGLVVEGNVLDVNGNPPQGRHHLYLQGLHTRVVGNRIGNCWPESNCVAVKDRSPGATIAWNWIDGDNLAVAIDLVEPQEHRDAVRARDDFGEAIVCGNYIRTSNIYRSIHFGGDVLAPSDFRDGPLWLTHNTFNFVDGYHWASAVVDVDRDDARAHLYGNAMLLRNERAGSLGITLSAGTGGYVFGSPNFIDAQWAPAKDGTPRLSGTENLLVGTAPQSSPGAVTPAGAVALASRAALANIGDADSVIPSWCLGREFDAEAGVGTRPRVIRGGRPALGAFEEAP